MAEAPLRATKNRDTETACGGVTQAQPPLPRCPPNVQPFFETVVCQQGRVETPRRRPGRCWSGSASHDVRASRSSLASSAMISHSLPAHGHVAADLSSRSFPRQPTSSTRCRPARTATLTAAGSSPQGFLARLPVRARRRRPAGDAAGSSRLSSRSWCRSYGFSNDLHPFLPPSAVGSSPEPPRPGAWRRARPPSPPRATLLLHRGQTCSSCLGWT